MGEWKRVKLSEVLKEKTERNRNNETDLVLSVTNSQGFVKQSDFFEGTVHSEDISNYKLVRKNEFAYNPSRINVGSIDILKEYDIGALSPMYVIFSVDETKLLPDYFKYYFQTHKFNENVKNKTQGSVRNSLSFKALSEFEYLLPPLEEQKRIVKILDQVNRIIEKYQNLINEKEQFIKSQFVEMFCDKEFEKIKLEKVANIYDGTHQTPKYLNNGIKFVSVENINNLYDTDKYISDEAFKEFKVVPEVNDLFMTRIGTIGKCAIITQKEELAYYVSLALIKIFSNKISSIYLKYLIESDFGIDELNKKTLTYATPIKINKNDIGKINIILAPEDLQKKFEQIVQLIDKQKFELEKQKQNYIDLKKGLMQQLLTGKLKV